jgi:hypothetical protein
MIEHLETQHTNPNEQSLEVLAQIFKEQLRLLGRLVAALRSVKPATKQAHAHELKLEIAASDARVMDASLRPRVAYERDEELPATD